MSTSEFQLAPAPSEPRERELWLQHAAGFILFEDARKYALARVDAALGAASKEAARQAIDDALYGMMMIIDGVSGALRDADRSVELDVVVRLRRGAEIVQQLNLRDGDCMCMGYHAWREGDFGTDPVATRRST
jgi:hypothetical protein